MKFRLNLMLTFLLVLSAQAQEITEIPPPESDSSTNTTAELMFHGQELFKMASISSVTADIRTETMVRRLKRAATSPLVSTENFTIHHDDTLGVSLIMHNADVICAIWDTDAALNDTPRDELAEKWHGIITGIIEQFRKDRTPGALLKNGLMAVGATLIYLIIWFLVRKAFKKEMQAVESKFGGHQMFKLLDGDTLVHVNHNTVKVIRGLIVITLFIVYLNIVLSFFPETYNLSAKLFEMLTTPVIKFWNAFVDNLPNLFALAVIVIITRFILRGLKHMFGQIAEGKVRIRGFYQDWSDTTYSLIRMLVIVFAAVIAFPYIPGSSSPAFKGISIFMGVLVSLGSSSAVGNIFGGLMLTYMRSFQPGDFVKINGMKGTVMASRTFSTRLKTPTNEIISIPNMAVSSNHIINYSRMTKSIGVNIGTAVTIGYDVPWRLVHEQLLKSAVGVPDVLEDPAPTILQLSLDDFYVKYKLVVSTKNPAGKFRILSNMHQNIQDNFAASGIEIMSPHYQADRSGEKITIPDDMGIPPDSEIEEI